MRPEEKEEIKKDIKKQIDDLKQRVAGLEISTRPVAPDSSIGRISRMDAIQVNAVGAAGLVRLREELHALEQKLLVIDAPGFGTCRSCKGVIGIERLKALPSTSQCIQCAEKYS